MHDIQCLSGLTHQPFFCRFYETCFTVCQEVYITDGRTRWGFEKQTKLYRTTCSYLVYAANIRHFVLFWSNYFEPKL